MDSPPPPPGLESIIRELKETHTEFLEDTEFNKMIEDENGGLRSRPPVQGGSLSRGGMKEEDLSPRDEFVGPQSSPVSEEGINLQLYCISSLIFLCSFKLCILFISTSAIFYTVNILPFTIIFKQLNVLFILS